MIFTSFLPTSRLIVVGARSPVDRRRKSLERVDKELSRGKYESALSLVKQLKGKHGHLSAFGSAKLLPKKLQALDKSDINRKTNLLELRSLIDSVYRTIESVSVEEQKLGRIQRDYIKRKILKQLHLKNIGSLLFTMNQGIFWLVTCLEFLPRHYEIPKLEALKQNESSVMGRVEFVGFEFLKEVGAANQLMKDGQVNLSGTQGNISAKTLNNFSCVILGGLVTEHILFGYSEGFYSDVIKLNNVLQWLGFTEVEKEAHFKWAVSNTVSLLHSYSEARVSLAETMAKTKPIGSCIEAIESAISKDQT